MASAVLDLPVVVGSRRLEVVSSTYGPSNSTMLVGEAAPLLVGWGKQGGGPSASAAILDQVITATRS